jgi:hypothetical protein
MSYHRRVVCVLALVVVMASTGCTYLKNRGNDASDTFELGITVTPRLMPTFALYANPFNVLPFGYANAQLTMLGWSDRNLGALDLDLKGWGALAWGSQRLGIGRRQVAAPGEQPAPLSWETTEPGHTYTTGFIGSPFGGDPAPGKTFGLCPKLLHIGWIGLYANGCPLEWADFVLGWTGLDIGHDDAPEYESLPTGGFVKAGVATTADVSLERVR